MKNKHLKSLVEKLRELDKQMTNTKVKTPSIKVKSENPNDLMDYVNACDSMIKNWISVLDEKSEKDLKALEYLNTQIALSQEEEEILKTLEEDPDNFANIDTKFFEDYGFIAEAIERAATIYNKNAKVWAKATKKDFKVSKNKQKEQIKFDEKTAVADQDCVFAMRIKLKCQKEYKNNPNFEGFVYGQKLDETPTDDLQSIIDEITNSDNQEQ